MSRIHNFSAGPAVLPLSVLEEAREALLEFNHSGLGIMECSHRSALFDGVIDTARERLRRLLSLSDDQEILFLHGGASSQFFMVPMNLLRGGRAAYVETGRWSTKAMEEAMRFGSVDVIYSSRADGFDHVPSLEQVAVVSEDVRYVHLTSNNTVAGTQFHHLPTYEQAPLVVDGSSDILCRAIDGAQIDILYAGAQKNLGPSGVTVVILRRDLLERCDPDLPTMLRYTTHVEKESMYNTPTTFGIYVIERVCAWIEDVVGGIDAMEARNRSKAERLYAAIDGTDFWQGRARGDSRSWMNVTFSTGDPELDTEFWQSANAHGMSGLKGHRSMGGLRASIYNAQTGEAIDALIDYMKHFERHRG